ncbi:ADP-ribosylglycohydrolase family protein [Rubellicoccus peritrichatus]|uniref:ADP-ribosylglycohydrolase family protein n=1 Tax=Rubellicoccus peritrichatus TaxID=3080537 RepID=A0AAQ3QTX5_9BACT|nr:ADP-ribosylglycohydrolase family protein [Puniceicoccus sp. CR14]WOO39405.1 ADP-ribosylglycohydrolase family protein [Puniceicoccus sp. CR14]
MREKILGCWLGKSVGGTLGMPFEGAAGPLKLTEADLNMPEFLPNDDLDLQIVWAHHLKQRAAGAPISPDLFSEAWSKHIVFPWDEYGITHRNDKYGIKGALRGSFDNYFGEGMGAAIRSEIWACIAPGNPEKAMALAWNDAAVDHSGEGIWAEVFLASLESRAFVETDIDTLIAASCADLPSDSKLRHAIELTQEWWKRSEDWVKVRGEILEAYPYTNFTHVIPNLAFTVLGLLAGKGDFTESVLIATNCGWDTDCTGATVGSILGIIAPDTFPSHFYPVDAQAVVLSPEIIGVPCPKDLSVLTDWTEELAEDLKDEVVSIGEVAPCVPESSVSFIEIPATIGRVQSGSATPKLVDARESILPGHWRQFTNDDFVGEPIGMTFPVNLESDSDFKKLMVSISGKAKPSVWLDGQKLEESVLLRPDLIDHAPSFHRLRRDSFSLDAFDAGEHEVTVVIDAPESKEEVLDLVIGVGDSKNQWVPSALARQVAGVSA